MPRIAYAYHHAGRLFVLPLWRSSQGLVVPGAPVATLPAGTADAEIGAALLTALHGAREGLPDAQGTVRADDHAVLAAAGVKRNATFVQDAAHLLVSTLEDAADAWSTVRIHASRRGRGSFEYLPERSSLSSPAEAAAIGATVRAAFARCQPPAELPAPAMGGGEAAPA